MRIMIKIIIITIITCSIEALNETQEEYLLNSLLSFNEDYISEIKDQWSRILVEDRQDEISVKIGILAMYFRIFKKIVPWSYQEKGFEHLYPTPIVDFDFEVATKCKIGIEACLDFIIAQLSTTQTWIIKDNIELDELKMSQIINNQRMGLEISASQVLCILTNSRIAAFEHIPYCRYRISSKGDPMIWTGKAFHNGTTIDEFYGKPFECATESFCPDPCCRNVPSVVRASPNYAHLCKMNKCTIPGSCIVKNYENDYLFNLRQNKFNVTCGCEKLGKIYRPDIGECVSHNPCNKMNLCREANMECANVASGYKCICQLGYYMSDSNTCLPLNVTAGPYEGFAFSEPDPSKPNSNRKITTTMTLILLLINFELYSDFWQHLGKKKGF